MYIGALTRDEREHVRLHAYHTERVFDGVPSLRPIAAVAALHHERGDGSGYHRALSVGSLPPTARILAAADVYAALVCERPYRPALTAPDAAATLRAEVRAGRLDADAGEAVLSAVGHRVGRRRTAVAGLTAREAEVLQHVARGLSTRRSRPGWCCPPRRSNGTSSPSTTRPECAAALRPRCSRCSTTW